MKKIISWILSVAMLASLCALLTSCFSDREAYERTSTAYDHHMEYVVTDIWGGEHTYSFGENYDIGNASYQGNSDSGLEFITVGSTIFSRKFNSNDNWEISSESALDDADKKSPFGTYGFNYFAADGLPENYTKIEMPAKISSILPTGVEATAFEYMYDGNKVLVAYSNNKGDVLYYEVLEFDPTQNNPAEDKELFEAGVLGGGRYIKSFYCSEYIVEDGVPNYEDMVK